MDYAKAQGVKRFVFLSASRVQEGKPRYRQVYAYLKGSSV